MECLLLFILAIRALATGTGSIDTITATYGNSPAPFNIDVHPQFIADTQAKVSYFRPVNANIGLPPFQEGPPPEDAAWLANYWKNQYNWTTVQNELNAL